MAIVSKEEWTTFVAEFPGAHLLQDPAWGDLKAAYGWKPRWLIGEGIGAQVLFRLLPLGFSVAYIPRGPVIGSDHAWQGKSWEGFRSDLDALCREEKAVFVKIEPDLWQDEGTGPFPPPGFQASHHDIQPPRTIVVDLTSDQEAILGRMKSKTRYNIRLASRKDVTVHQSSDIGEFYRLLSRTSDRADFGVHEEEYFHLAYDLFSQRGMCQLFTAEYSGQALASIMVFRRGKRAWYLYGASSSAHRDRMPTYLVQWEAMRWMKANGCRSYDLWGVPDASFKELEEQFLERSDGLWGVYRFKRGFGGDLKRTRGSWDRVYRPMLYRLYRLRMGQEE